MSGQHERNRPPGAEPFGRFGDPGVMCAESPAPGGVSFGRTLLPVRDMQICVPQVRHGADDQRRNPRIVRHRNDFIGRIFRRFTEHLDVECRVEQPARRIQE